MPHGRMRVVALLAGLAALLLASAPAHAGKGPAFRYTYVGKIGSRGNAPGQFAGSGSGGPGAVAIDQGCGNVYIGDGTRGVVYRYDENGKFLNQIGKPGDGPDQMEQPSGVFVDGFVAPMNPHGPPRHCVGIGAMGPLIWVADNGAHRVSVFDQSGEFKGAWCNSIGASAGCDVQRGGSTGFDFLPNDVWVNGDSVYVAGRVANKVTQYNRSGEYIRETDRNVAAYSIAAYGTLLWTTYTNHSIASFSLNPNNSTLSFVHEYGSTFGSAPGQFANPKSIWINYDGRLFVLDGTRVQVFSPSGRYLSTIRLPRFSEPVDVATRYDGTVYVTDAVGHGARVYSPGPIVSLRKAPGEAREIVLTGRVTPAHAKRTLSLERLTGGGWHTITTLRLDRRSRFRYAWQPPRRHVHYSVRASFKDPHRYHADRASAIIDVASG
jgi:hypothetical protein